MTPGWPPTHGNLSSAGCIRVIPPLWLAPGVLRVGKVTSSLPTGITHSPGQCEATDLSHLRPGRKDPVGNDTPGSSSGFGSHHTACEQHQLDHTELVIGEHRSRQDGNLPPRAALAGYP